MEIRQSILGEIALRSGQQLVGVDIGALVRRLVLFDRIVVKSYRLRELSLLVRSFGKTGFKQLLDSGVVKLCCEFTVTILDMHKNGVRSVPAEHFTFGTADAADRDGLLRGELRALQSVPGLKNNERSAIEESVWKSLLRPQTTFGADLLQQIDFDLRANSPSLKAAIVDQLQKELGRSDWPADQLQIKVEEPQHRVFHIQNNITTTFELGPEKTHALLQRSVAAVSNLNHRLAEMQAYSAITGFLQSEAPFLFGKVAAIVAPLNPDIAEKQFKRVIELADIPDFKPGQRVDVEKLMNIRNSKECRDFRGWLSTLENATDAEIRDMTGSMRSKLASLASGPLGKAVRFAVTTGLGLIPGYGPLLGPTAGAVDSFLVDRVLPRSGVLAFLAETYPSLFVSP